MTLLDAAFQGAFLADTLRLSFDRPLWLLALLVLVPYIVLTAWRSAASIEPWSLRLSTTVRLLVVALLIATLAEPLIRRESTDRAVIVVMDDSASVPNAAHERARTWLRQASTLDRAAQDRLGVISAGRDAVVQALPTAHTVASFEGARANGEGTNLESALRLAIALAPADAGTRIVLASDGNETAGDLSRAASAAAALGVPIDILPIPFQLDQEVLVDEIHAPPSARPDTAVRVRVVLRSTKEASGTLRLQIRGSTHDDLLIPVSLNAGINEYTVRATVGGGGPTRFRAVFEPAGEGAAAAAIDTREENNQAEAITFVTPGSGRVLVIESSPDEGRPLANVLRNAELTVDVEPTGVAPQSLAEWGGYDAVVMINQPTWVYTAAQQAQIPRAVHDLGVGLVMIGGPHAYGAGAWQGSALEPALPMLLEPKVERRNLRGALCIVIDVSGSMGQPVAGTSASRIDLAIEAAVSALESLSTKDYVAVIAFAGDYRIAVPLGPNTDPRGSAAAIRSASPMGGTNLYPALRAAGQLLLNASGGVRHVLAISDGETMGTPQEGAEIAGLLAQAGITVTTIGIAEGSGADTLRAVAAAGGGQFHPLATAAGMAQLPAILIQEAMTLRRTLISEGDPFEPAATGRDAWIAENSPMPPLTGYVVTADRGGLSEITLRGPEGDPLLARWQYGLGRVLCFMSDTAPRWAAAWTKWPSFEAFWARQVRWVLRPPPRSARTELQIVDGTGHVTLELRDADGSPLPVDALIARIVPDDKAAVPVEFVRTASGTFRATVELPDASTYLLSTRWMTDGVADGSQAAFVRPTSPEHRFLRDDASRLAHVARATGGRVLDVDAVPTALHSREAVKAPIHSRAIWPLLALIAGGLMIVDIAVRRLRFDRSTIATAAAAFTPAATSAPLATRLRKHRVPGDDGGADTGAAGAPSRVEADGAAVSKRAAPQAVVPEGQAPPPGAARAPTSPAKSDGTASSEPADTTDSLVARLRKHRARSGGGPELPGDGGTSGGPAGPDGSSGSGESRGRA